MVKWLWILLAPSALFGAVRAEWDKLPSGREWTSITLKAMDDLGGELLSMEAPKDAHDYCPRFTKLTRDQKKAFYVGLLSSMARLESGLNPKTAFTEKFKDAKGKRVVSRGLLQMSEESAKHYGCPIAKGSDLHQPKHNLRCAVAALNKWVSLDRRIGYGKLGGARYWAVLRPALKGKIQAQTKSLPFCREVRTGGAWIAR